MLFEVPAIHDAQCAAKITDALLAQDLGASVQVQIEQRRVRPGAGLLMIGELWRERHPQRASLIEFRSRQRARRGVIGEPGAQLFTRHFASLAQRLAITFSLAVKVVIKSRKASAFGLQLIEDFLTQNHRPFFTPTTGNLTRNAGIRTKSKEQGATNKEQRTRSKEQRAKNKEQRTRSAGVPPA